jgi:N-acetyl-anhydromuramyl-L-alanine amidase AmpD
MMELELDHSRPAHPLNYGDRRGTKIDKVIIHTTQGECPDEKKAGAALNWFANPDAQASAHFVIAPTGKIYQCVDETHAAWHAGNSAYNRRSVGIECAGDCFQKKMWTPALFASLCSLVADICKRFKIAPDQEHVMGHADVPDPRNPGKYGGAHGHTDPGKFFPWDRFFQTVKGMVKP